MSEEDKIVEFRPLPPGVKPRWKIEREIDRDLAFASFLESLPTRTAEASRVFLRDGIPVSAVTFVVGLTTAIASGSITSIRSIASTIALVGGLGVIANTTYHVLLNRNQRKARWRTGDRPLEKR